MAKTDISIEELVNKVKRGELKLPEMQRRYVWKATRVRDLLDSLYRGYPSGTILVWQTEEEVETRDLSIAPVQTPTVNEKLLLLDGQQRITSLSAIITGNPVTVRSKGVRTKNINILFNLDHPEDPLSEVTEVEENGEEELTMDIEGDETEDDNDDDIEDEGSVTEELRKRTFVVESRSLKNDPKWVSVSDIFIKTDKDILKRLGINSDDDKWDKYAGRLQKIRDIKKYQYVMQVLEKNLSYEEVTEIFVRVNSLGIKLRGSDLALAQITSKWSGFTKKIEELSKEFTGEEDFINESGIPVRLLVVFATGQSKFKTVGRLSLETLMASWEKAVRGLRFAINFLKSNANVESLSLISSPFLLVPIAYYAVTNDEKITTENEKKLLRWFYWAHMRAHYGMGSTEAYLDIDINSLKETNNLDDLLAKLKTHVKFYEFSGDELQYRTKRSPVFSMMYLVLKHNGARDWWSSLNISMKHIGKSHKLQFHHIFPKSLLKDENYTTKEINEIANMAFIGGKTNRRITNKKPIEYFEDIISHKGNEVLESQLIPMDKDLWELKNYNIFLEGRRNKIADTINNFLKQFE